MRLAVGGEKADGVGVGLDGSGALVLGLQGAPEAPVENQGDARVAVADRRVPVGPTTSFPSLGCGGAAG
jgi:hypothetical protein